jgi:uncharacterized membrane protein YcaP (DUF421 family)
MAIPPVHWDKLFIFTVSPLELFIRGTVIYLLVLIMMRVFRREPGTVGIADLLLLVLIADASQNAMAAQYESVLDGLILVLTLVFWNYFLDWLTVQWPPLERFTYPAAVPFVRNGKMNEANMRRQFITREQLLSMIREHGIDDISKVKSAALEGSGHMSVIPYDDDEKQPEDDRRKRPIG